MGSSEGLGPLHIIQLDQTEQNLFLAQAAENYTSELPSVQRTIPLSCKQKQHDEEWNDFHIHPLEKTSLNLPSSAAQPLSRDQLARALLQVISSNLLLEMHLVNSKLFE